MEGIGAVPALKRSSGMLRQRWGEGLTGTLAIGAWSVLVMVPVCVLIGLGAATVRRHPETGIALLAVGLIALVAFSTLVSATRQVFAVALYRYAIDAPAGGFSLADLNDPFTPAEEEAQVLDPADRRPDPRPLRGPDDRRRDLPPSPPHGRGRLLPRLLQRPAGAELQDGDAGQYRRRQIGSIVGLTLEGEQVRVSFRVDPRFRYVVETHRHSSPVRGSRSVSASAHGASATTCRRRSKARTALDSALGQPDTTGTWLNALERP